MDQIQKPQPAGGMFCPTCKMPWGYHPRNPDGDLECHIFFEKEAGT